MEQRVSVIIATRNRAANLRTTLARLRALPERPRVVVVDNGSTDDTVDFVRQTHPEVQLVPLVENLGGAARTIGVRAAQTPYTAFSDDDSWWAPGALTRAADLLDTHPRLALIAARVMVGDAQRIDPTCTVMAASPIPRRQGVPGPPVLGFLACGSILRRSAYLDVGGFELRFGIGGEEELLALDLAGAGWDLAYLHEIVAHHHPSTVADRRGRRRVQVRNALWSAWLRRPLRSALGRTVRLMRPAAHDPELLAALLDALKGLPWVIRGRRTVPPDLERCLKLIGNFN